MSQFADVILPLPLANRFTYSVPQHMTDAIGVGHRVVVSFGKKKFYTGIVVELHDRATTEYEIKPLEALIDNAPIVTDVQLRFWSWVADYYLCTIGEVYKAAVPSGLKLESETQVCLNDDYVAMEQLTPSEQKLLDLLNTDSEQCISQLQRSSKIKNILPVIQNLLSRGAVTVKEELKQSYKIRSEVRVRFADADMTDKKLHVWLDVLKRSAKQKELVLRYIELSAWTEEQGAQNEVSKKNLMSSASASASAFKELIGKKLLETYEVEIGRLNRAESESQAAHKLNEAQQQAFDNINTCFAEKNVCLLHGVTSSGKTEIYIHIIKQALQQGKQVLYMLPEIALTTQITERLKCIFGNDLGVYHSKFTDAERVEIWRKQLSDNPYKIILGVRSSVFLPFKNLGMVIVDEEHENSYKQQDPAPRYQGRNAALVLAGIFGAKTLLGTATPSIETYYHATMGKYGLVELSQRYKDIQLPQIEVVDVKEQVHQKKMKGPFSPLLIMRMREALERHEQIILFQNRRGFSPMMECHVCGWVPKCKNCDVSLTYHKDVHQLICHYCGAVYAVPKVCPACSDEDVRNLGYGTERIEDEIKMLFPEVAVARMDLDTTRSRTAYERIIADFEAGKTKILIGTQMISKGLDFDNVSVVGILNADTLLNYPDFRSHERSFQLMAQVAGRAGRRGKQGLVVLQTKSVDVPIIHQVVRNDYLQMYYDQIAERQMFKYPPFYKFVYVFLKHKNMEVVDEASALLVQYLGNTFHENVLGPDNPPVARVQRYHIRKILIKLDLSVSMKKVRNYLLQVQSFVLTQPKYKQLIIYFDVDPQ